MGDLWKAKNSFSVRRAVLQRLSYIDQLGSNRCRHVIVLVTLDGIRFASVGSLVIIHTASRNHYMPISFTW